LPNIISTSLLVRAAVELSDQVSLAQDAAA
jgi:hypothetical protein